MQRNQFIKSSLFAFAGATLLPRPSFSQAHFDREESRFIIGPTEGYSPYIGILVSMMNYMRLDVLAAVKKLTQPDLDFLLDAKANTIGALLLHLASADYYYHVSTFGNRQFNEEENKKYGLGLELGDKGRQVIKGHDLNYYTDILNETRDKTLAEFKKRDDKWLMTVTPQFFDNMPTNNYCKWFHVCEHESHHLGQIDFQLKRLPSAKNDGKE